MMSVGSGKALVSSSTLDASYATGPLRFMVAVILKWVKASGNSMSIGGSSSKDSTVGTTTVTLVAPATDTEFFEMLNLFTVFCHAFGHADVLICSTFISLVVHEMMRRRNYSWMMGYCLFMVFLKRIDDGAPSEGITMANVYSDGGFDGHAEDAANLGAQEYGASFRRLRGEPRDVTKTKDASRNEGGKPFNGKDTKDAKKPCFSYNHGKKHPPTSLTEDGTCRFKHVCFKWVAGHGKNAICGSRDHTFDQCDHPDKCDDAASA